MTTQPPSDGFRPKQIYEQVAETIRASIVDGSFPVQSRLPSERDLATQLGVSRPAVREAIGALQNEGLVTTRHGSGTYVQKLPPGQVVKTEQTAVALAMFSALDAFSDMSPVAILEARLILEPAIARLAAGQQKRDAMAEHYLAQMSKVYDVDNPQQQQLWRESDRMFHRQLAVMTGNPLIIKVADVIAGVMGEPLWNRLRDDGIFTAERISLYAAEHRLIYEAIQAGDGNAAAVYIEGHLKRVRKDIVPE